MAKLEKHSPKDNSISQEEFERFIVDKIGVAPPCPMCKHEKWVFLGFSGDLRTRYLLWHPSVEEENNKFSKLENYIPNLVKPYSQVPFIVTSCLHCGFVANYYAPVFDDWKKGTENG